jgi:uncharacterized protein
MEIVKFILAESNLSETQIKATLKLLEDGGTIPFIARYRKEATGNLDELQIQQIRDLKLKFEELEKRRKSILSSLQERDLLTEALRQQLMQVDNIVELEDIYFPFRAKKRTRAEIARERGLGKLAEELLKQQDGRIDLKRYVNPANEVPNQDAALAGARDIIAEKVSEDRYVRQALRQQFVEQGTLHSRVIKTKKDAAEKFRDYFDHKERLKFMPSHRLLAVLRGVSEKFLRVSVRPDEIRAVKGIERIYKKGYGFSSRQVMEAIEDSYKRLLAPSIENEVLKDAKVKADEEAVKVFSQNLKDLLMAAPLGAKNVLAFDPGFRSGAKVAALDKHGILKEYCNLFPFDKKEKASTKTKQLCEKYSIEAIAVGNGTAGRETETFLRGLDLGIDIIMVDESGASIYSASETARKEFPDLDLTVRGAISIGRRLQDPLAELVKVDPKSIGVGQYQHDVDQNMLRGSLDDRVMASVNAVGVNLNNASGELLGYVAGLGPKLAENIVKYRSENGSFRNRRQLKNVPRLGEKAFEQAAGFLRIYNGDNPLDQSAVHPESYQLVKQFARDLKLSESELIGQPLQDKINFDEYPAGELTLIDILKELEKPGRDPRAVFKVFSFDETVHSINDLHPGLKLPGIITNVTKFGAFVDIGVHQDGLVHISKLTQGYISDPTEVVKVKQQVEVTVLEVDAKRKRISLSMVD